MVDPSMVLAGVEACVKYGTILVEACVAWKNADQEIQDRIAEIEDCWNRTRLQVDLLVRIQATLDSEHRRITSQNLGLLAERLSSAVSTVEGVLQKESAPRSGFLAFPTKAKRTKYVFVKSSLDDIISDLESWQRRFDPSWFLIMKIASDVIDRELEQVNPSKWSTPSSSNLAVTNPTKKSPIVLASRLREVVRRGRSHHSVFLSQEPLDSIPIPYSNARAGRRKKAADTKWLIIDSIACRPGADFEALERDVRQLATKLSQADPFTFGLLNCKGVMRSAPGPQRGISSFDMVFRAPGRPEALQSLRQLLLSPDKRLSLSFKIQIAKELAKSVSYVHTFNFVHKNIRPESILLFEGTDLARRTFLVGFDSFRSADGATSLVGDLAWEKNMYRHPLRQGEHLEEDYRMQHDIYSLGVCLLEVGLWESFVGYTDDTNPQLKMSESYLKFEAWLKESDPLQTQKSPRNQAFLGTMAFKLKDYLVERARVELPPRLGDKYTRVVLACLTCLDEDNEQFGDPVDMVDEDGILVAVRFIEKILLQLEGISI